MKLIQTKEYLLLINPEEVKTDMWSHITVGTLFWSPTRDQVTDLQPKELGYDPSGFKLVAYYPLNNSSKELDLPLLPNPFSKIENIKRLARECEVEEQYLPRNATFYYGFIKGYKAQSKQFSLEDMQNFAAWLDGNGEEYNSGKSYETLAAEFIQSLSTQQLGGMHSSLPKDFEPEYAFYDEINKSWFHQKYLKENNWNPNNFERKMNIITNSEGKEIIQGTYKY